MEIRKATRQGVKPLIGIYGKSGGGKTLTALYVARGLVGPNGRIILCDSESGRGSLFADIVPGSYHTIDIEPPFSPENYQAAIEMAEANADCVVVDSMSHEWSGENGILDMQEQELDRMAGNDWKKRDQCKMSAWIRPKMAHKKFIQRLLRLKVPLICCLRGEEKTHVEVGDDGKKRVITDKFSTPLFDPRFIFEMLINFECYAKDGQGGYVIPRKITHPGVAPLLPKDNEQLGIKHGELLAQWCANAGGSKPAQSSLPSRDKLAKEFFELTRQKHNGDAVALSQFCVDEMLIPDDKTLKDCNAEELQAAITKYNKKFA